MVEQIIDKSEERLKLMKRASEAAEWARNNQETVMNIIHGYDELITWFNETEDNNPALEIMPVAKKLKETLGGKKLPTSEQLHDFSGTRRFVEGLHTSVGPMVAGQTNKEKANRGTNLTPTEIKYAIGTTSMNIPTEALVVGTIGHLYERTLMAWMTSEGINPSGGHEKDDVLQALDQTLMLMHEEGTTSELFDYFIKPNSEGGLGWLNQKDLDKFHTDLESLSR
jgi:hypothetical protein